MIYETVDERITRLEELGYIDKNCKTCQKEYYPAIKEGRIAYGPKHKASERCESGKRPHCTCDTCF